MLKHRLFFSYFIFAVGLWWGWTVLVDFFIIPTVFKTIPDFFHAGHLGVAVFTKLNTLELIVSTTLMGLFSLKLRKNTPSVILFIMALLLWVLVMFYFGYLTEKITELTHLWEKVDFKGVSGTPSIPDVQQEHQRYHQLYRLLDSLKLLLLSAMLGYGVFAEEKWR